MTNEYFFDSSRSQPKLHQEINELFKYRFLLRLMVKNDILTRYKRSVLGVVWTVLNPLLMMLVISFAFSLLFGRLPGYPIYVLSGMLYWNFFTQTTMMTSRSLVWGGNLMKRIYFPRSTFVFSNTGSGIFNLLIGFIPLILIMLVYRFPLTPALLFLPVSIIITSLFIMGISFFLSAIAVFFSDVVEFYQVVLRALFYLTPIMYPVDILPAPFSTWIKFNPAYSFLTIFRAPIYYGELPSLETIGIATAYACITFFLGARYFIKKSNEIAYRI